MFHQPEIERARGLVSKSPPLNDAPRIRSAVRLHCWLSHFLPQTFLGQIQHGELYTCVKLILLTIFFHTENMPSENILSHFWELASLDEKTRLKAASQLLQALNQAQTQHKERTKVRTCMITKCCQLTLNFLHMCLDRYMFR